MYICPHSDAKATALCDRGAGLVFPGRRRPRSLRHRLLRPEQGALHRRGRGLRFRPAQRRHGVQDLQRAAPGLVQ